MVRGGLGLVRVVVLVFEAWLSILVGGEEGSILKGGMSSFAPVISEWKRTDGCVSTPADGAADRSSSGGAVTGTRSGTSTQPLFNHQLSNSSVLNA